LKTFTITLLSILITVGLIFGLQYLDLFSYSIFAPKYEQVRRETFEQSKAYNDGMVQELESMRLDYTKANDEQKAALASVILHRSAAYQCERMPYDLCQFIQQLKSGK